MRTFPMPPEIAELLGVEMLLDDGSVGRIALVDGVIRSEVFTEEGWVPGLTWGDVLNGRPLNNSRATS